MSWNKNKVWTKEELASWAEKQKVHNAKYLIESKHQIEEWVKGNSIHNPLSSICAVVDNDGNIVGYIDFNEGGECCPDFSCCNGGQGWSLEKRQKFKELYDAGNTEACHEMLFSTLTHISELTGNSIYVSGQIQENCKVH